MKVNKLILLLRKNRLNDAQKVLKDLESSYSQEELQLESYIKAKLFVHIKNHDDKEINNILDKISSNKTLEFLLRIEYLRESKKLDQIFN